MKSLTLISISLLTVLFSAKLKAQNQNNVLALITETTEYQTSKKAGENLFASLHNDVPEAYECRNMLNMVRKHEGSIKSELDALYKLNWSKLELNYDGSIWLELPFTFSFFDSLRKTIWINTNRNLSFDQSIGHFEPESLPINAQMIAPFWADLEANIQNEDAGIFILTTQNELRILYNKMSLYKQDPHHTITFEVIVKAVSDSSNGNLAFIYHQVAPELIAMLNNLKTKSRPAYIIGINAGDDINYLQMEQFESIKYVFNLGLPRP